MSPLTPRSAGIHVGFRRVASLLVGLLVAIGPSGSIGASAPPADDPTLVATDGTRTIEVSKSRQLSESGESIRVVGSGFDTTRGIYVALCVVQPPDQQPSPCGGGVDRAGATGASIWISSNPPAYGVGLAIPYGEGGSFDVEFAVSPSINDVIDCRAVECAIVTKSDHTIAEDRSQDLVIPVTFTGVAPTTTIGAATSTSVEAVPEITVTADVSDLARTATGDDGGASTGTVVMIGLAVLVIGTIVVVVRVKRRRRGAAS